MNNGSSYCQHPIGLWEAEPFASVKRDLGPYAEGIYWRVFEMIRKGQGIDSLEHILTAYDDIKSNRDREPWLKRLKLMLQPKYNLFVVTPQRMVRTVNHAKLIIEENKKALEEGPTLFDINNL